MQNYNLKSKIVIFILFLAGFSLFFSQVFSGRWILPQAFSVGFLTIRYYGLFIAAAVSAGFYFAVKRAGHFGIDGKKADDLLFWVVVLGFLGARMYHVLSSLDYYRGHLIDALKVWNGGLSIYGAVLGGILALIICRKFFTFHFSLFTLLNWLTPSLIVGQIIGRFGNLFNYEVYGYPTNLPWKMFVPTEFRVSGFLNHGFYHPWFLYEQVGLVVILSLILRLENKGKRNLFLYYILLYNVLRFALEFLRIDSPALYGFRQNALLSLVLVIVAAAILSKRYYVRQT